MAIAMLLLRNKSAETDNLHPVPRLRISHLQIVIAVQGVLLNAGVTFPLTFTECGLAKGGKYCRNINVCKFVTWPLNY
jgi:hypothetical protein